MRPRLPRPAPRHAVVLLALTCLTQTPAFAQERRDRLNPGLVLNTGARHASCDVLLFSPDGKELLAAGDDKVVRVWRSEKNTLRPDSRVLRWPILREQKGGIYAMALSPDDGGRRVAVTGFGLKTGLVAVLDRESGKILHVLDDDLASEVNWALAWSPNGRYVVFGNEKGVLYRWEPRAPRSAPVAFAGPAVAKDNNRVRLIAFVDDRHFLSVAQDGKVWKRGVNDHATAPKAPIAAFEGKTRQTVSAAAFSPASGRLAVCQEYRPGLVLWMDLKGALAGNAGKPTTKFLDIPQDDQTDRFAWSLAFNASGDRLAAGTRDANRAAGVLFARTTGGRAFVYSLGGPKVTFLTSKQGFDCGYAVDALAFHPTADDQLATAGGPHHEVRLWKVGAESAPLANIRGQGSCLYGVRFDVRQNYIAWQEQPNPRPATPNDRGTGGWRYFKLDPKSRQILTTKPADYKAHDPLTTYDGWSVQQTADSYVWEVVDGRKGEPYPLTGRHYALAEAQLPRCYAFLPPAGKGKPVRLAVGHMWGVTLYELHRDAGVKLARYMVGHEGEVMALAPSADGKQLLTASRDQTIVCWNLEEWPTQREMGASFKLGEDWTTRDWKGDPDLAKLVKPGVKKLIVDKVDTGSPAWELGLADGDEVVLIASKYRQDRGALVYDPLGHGLKRYDLKSDGKLQIVNDKEMIGRLREAEPVREYVFVWRQPGGKVQRERTTVRQRPMWRFFPTRQEAGAQWVLWRWRDFFYDTASPQADRLVGWHVNRKSMTTKPGFYRLADMAGEGFFNHEKVWEFVKNLRLKPEQVIFPDIEPPEVQVRPRDREKGDPVKLDVVVRPRDDSAKQKVTRIILWLNDVRFELRPGANGVLDKTFNIKESRLRNGENRIKVVAFNARGGRSDDSVVVEYRDPERPPPTLRALCVGINYANKPNLKLNFPAQDAKDMSDLFRRQGGGKLYAASEVQLVPEQDATEKAILAALNDLAKGAGPDDLLVVFLAGHGLGGKNTETDVFRFLCADGSELTGDDLSGALGKIACRKLILLNACFSGNATQSSPTRALNNKEGAEFRIFSACKPGQKALDLSEKDFKALGAIGRKNTLFTTCLLLTLEGLGKRGPASGEPIRDADLAEGIERRMRVVLEKLGKTNNEQEPEFFPDLKTMKETPVPILSRR